MEANTNASRVPQQQHHQQHVEEKPSRKSLAVFLCQIVLIYIVVLTSIINLSILDCTKPGVCNLWIVLLSSSLGVLLPNPSFRLPGSNKSRTSVANGADSYGSMANFAGSFSAIDGAAVSNSSAYGVPDSHRPENDSEVDGERRKKKPDAGGEAEGKYDFGTLARTPITLYSSIRHTDEDDNCPRSSFADRS